MIHVGLFLEMPPRNDSPFTIASGELSVNLFESTPIFMQCVEYAFQKSHENRC